MQDRTHRSAAIDFIQSETKSCAGAPRYVVRELLQLTCVGLLIDDDKHVDHFGFAAGESALDSAGVPRSEYPYFMRAATAFCPNALGDVTKHYGSGR